MIEAAPASYRPEELTIAEVDAANARMRKLYHAIGGSTIDWEAYNSEDPDPWVEEYRDAFFDHLRKALDYQGMIEARNNSSS